MTRRLSRRALLGMATLAGGPALSGCADVLGSVRSDSFETGSIRWQTSLDGDARGPFRIDDGIVYVGAAAGGANDYQLYGLSRADGSRHWATRLGDWTPGVALDDGVLYAGTAGGEVVTVGATTGDVRWTTDGWAKISAVPTVVDGTIYLGDADGQVFALDVATGSRRWGASSNQRVAGGPRVVDGHVLVGGRNLLYAFDPDDGTTRWSTLVAGPVLAPVTGHRGAAYVSAGNTVHRVDVETGERVWRFDADLAVRRSATVAGDTVYAASDDGHLYALDRATGEPRWAFEADDGLVTRPALDDGRIHVGSTDGYLYALDAAGGESLWRVEIGDGVGPAPTAADGTVYAGDWNDTVYAVTGPR